MADLSNLDERLTRLAELLEEALDLVADGNAPDHLVQIAKLCRDAADCASS